VVLPAGDYDDYASITTALNDALVATMTANASLATEVQSIHTGLFFEIHLPIAIINY